VSLICGGRTRSTGAGDEDRRNGDVRNPSTRPAFDRMIAGREAPAAVFSGCRPLVRSARSGPRCRRSGNPPGGCSSYPSVGSGRVLVGGGSLVGVHWLAVSSSVVMGSSQQGQSPPVPTRVMKVLQSQRCSPRARWSQSARYDHGHALAMTPCRGQRRGEVTGRRPPIQQASQGIQQCRFLQLFEYHRDQRAEDHIDEGGASRCASP